MTYKPKAIASEELFGNYGEMYVLMQMLDWSQTPLGSFSESSRSLKTAVSIILNSCTPMSIWWGVEYTNLYNDAFVPILSTSKHPKSFGKSAKECWSEIWDILGSIADSVFMTGQPAASDEILLIINRYGYLEETYFSFSYSPVPDDQGGVGGLLCTVTETTQRVIGERRLGTLRELASNKAEAKTVEEVCTNLTQTLSQNPNDIPFALLYLVEAEGNQACLAGHTTSIAAGTPISPGQVDLTQDADFWHLAQVSYIQTATLITNLTTQCENLPQGALAESPQSALVIPIAKLGQKQKLAGLLVVGISPRRKFDEDYQGFLDLVTNNIAIAIANADAEAAEHNYKQEALYKSEERYRAFIAQSSEGIWRFELEEPISVDSSEDEQIECFYQSAYLAECNQVLAQMYDFSSIPEILGARLKDFLVRSDPHNEEYLRAFIRSGYRLVDAQSHEVDIHGNPKYIQNNLIGIVENGFLVRAWGTQRDITDAYQQAMQRKQIEEKLSESERLYRAIGESLDYGIWVCDPEGRNIYASDSFLQLVGLTQEECSEFGWGQVLHPDDTERTIAAWQECVKTQGIWDIEHRFRGVDGNWHPMLARGMPVKNERGEVTCWAGINLDISRLKQVEERFRVIVNQAAVGIAQTDLTGQFLLVNQRYCDIVGYPMAELLQMRMQDITHLEDLPCNIELFQSLRETGNDFSIEKRYIRKDGSEVWVSNSVSSICDSSGKPQSALAIVLDISERKQTEAEREQLLEREQAARSAAEAANRIKDEFLAVLSHELRSPLNPILGWSKLLQTRKFDAAKTNQALATIERNAKLQAELITDLLDVSRILQGKIILNVYPVDLTFMIQAAIETVRLAAIAKTIEIHTILDSTVGQVAGDPSRLQQVIWNLLSNAVKFTPPGGRVEVQLSKMAGGAGEQGSRGAENGKKLQSSVPNPQRCTELLEVSPIPNPHYPLSPEGAPPSPIASYAQIIVSDTGKGIDPDFIPYVFEHFRQADAATTRNFGGLGLGMAIARHLVELHGGTIQAQSPGIDQGATFIVRLPLMLAQPQVNHDISQPKPFPNLPGIKILVVDDDIDTREFIAFLLEQYGASVKAVASADEVFAVLNQFQPDLLLSDIGMPGVDGYMLIRQLRSLPPEQGGEILAIALTAYAGELNQQQALTAGFQRHITKPIEPQELLQAIAELASSKILLKRQIS